MLVLGLGFLLTVSGFCRAYGPLIGMHTDMPAFSLLVEAKGRAKAVQQLGSFFR